MAAALVRRLERLVVEGMDEPSAKAAVRIVAEAVDTGEVPTEAAFAPLRRAAARLAQEGAPLGGVLAAAGSAGRAAASVLATAAERERPAALAAIGPLHLVTAAIAEAVATAHAEELQHLAAARQTAEWALVDAFLAGRPTAEAAARAGRRLAAAYGVLLVQGPVDRQHLRRFEAAIAGLGGGEALWRLTAAGANVLVPVPPAESSSWLEGADGLLRDLAAAGGDAPLLATAAWGEGPDGVARAGDDAVQVLRLVSGTGRPPGLYRLDDVLLEAALSGTAPGPAARLAAILAPLGGDLVTTLEAYLGADADRRTAATALHIHPNTLDYRLRRIGELTGRSPSTARGLQVLGAALTLRRVTRTVSTRYS
jgi:hypothetical protein